MRLGVESGSVAWVLVSGLPLSRWVLLDAPRTPHLPELRSLDTKELIVQGSRALSVPPPGPKLLRARVVLKVGWCPCSSAWAPRLTVCGDSGAGDQGTSGHPVMSSG